LTAVHSLQPAPTRPSCPRPLSASARPWATPLVQPPGSGRAAKAASTCPAGCPAAARPFAL